QNCSPSHRNRVHLPTGMLFGITTEWRSASARNRVHLRPDSPAVAKQSLHGLWIGSDPDEKWREAMAQIMKTESSRVVIHESAMIVWVR
ncbi:MAG: hypothetical protein WB762_32245, partial [Candidatus Sulfotelmatobacter sp.]